MTENLLAFKFLFYGCQTCPFCNTILTIMSAEVHNSWYHNFNGYFIMEPFFNSSYCMVKHEG